MERIQEGNCYLFVIVFRTHHILGADLTAISARSSIVASDVTFICDHVVEDLTLLTKGKLVIQLADSLLAGIHSHPGSFQMRTELPFQDME